MPVKEIVQNGGVTSPAGFLAGATYCGIKSGGLDLAIIFSTNPCAAAAMFTTNKVKAAPIAVSREHVANGRAQAIVVNSGNANACTGDDGYASAQEMAKLAADKVGILAEDVLVASTGVIGVPLAIEKVRAGIGAIELSPDGGNQAAQAIITTDTHTKEIACSVRLRDAMVTIGGMAKGAGMIHPNMATMLSFITTDAAVEPSFLAAALRRAVAVSFNMISVDGDTSTNDTIIALANGAAGNEMLTAASPDAAAFEIALQHVAITLAKTIARDGEGATKLIEASVSGAASTADARLAARAVVSSDLVKSAIHGNDPNWGRVLAAIGYSGAEVDQNRVDLAIGDIQVLRAGVIQPFDKAYASSILKATEVFLKADLHLGEGAATAWGCDLSEEYVVVNSEYTT
ncbi:MAG: bifunctional glutamate N-acetyltransferase/amino-acid acetyltransferase ArgJ [Chloroflexi bacterium]|nr:bifunctional glutamate N-acetyltransferase/amino-acid acetyltransferase ArgJ [Chloroflexota bacterium]